MAPFLWLFWSNALEAKAEKDEDGISKNNGDAGKSKG